MILCADDFGLQADIDEAILELCALGKLSAVSCLVLFQRCCADRLRELRRFRERLDLGLHLCLTAEPAALSPRNNGAEPILFSSFTDCLRNTFGGTVGKARLLREISAQHETFVSMTGLDPDYIDGHLHIHQAPIVSEALIEFVLSLPEKRRPYIRNTRMPVRQLRRHRLPWLKAWVVGKFGQRMADRLRSAGLRTNSGFAGIYGFERTRRFESYFPRFINCLDNINGILVVHPGRNETWRRHEFETIGATDFAPPPNKFSFSS